MALKRVFRPGVLVSLVLIAALWLSGLVFLRKVWFYRDPERRPDETSPSAVISPADGQVLYIKHVSSGNVVSEKLGSKIRVRELAKVEGLPDDGLLIGIYMSPFDVHYNYAPIDARLTRMFHTQAKVNLPMVDFWEYIRLAVLRRTVDLFGKRYHLENERNTMVLSSNGRPEMAMVQIADKFVNKIKPFVAEGDDLAAGQKVGFIERGSQVDLVIFSTEVVPVVSVGEQVYGGKTVLARYKKTE